MKYYNTKQIFLIPSFVIKEKEVLKINRFLELLEKSGVCDFLKSITDKELEKGGRPSYNQYNLLALVLYCFAFDKLSLRDIEEACFFDLRVIYIMNNEFPTHMTISNFINNYIVPNRERIFALVSKAIFTECMLSMDTIFIDGSKFEANANKYKFVWKPTKFHEKLCIKIYNLLQSYNLSRDIIGPEIINSKIVANKIIEFKNLLSTIDTEDKSNKHYSRSYNLLTEFLSKILEYEEKERICGPNRNSYYKTDHDATGMCLKEDYYSGLGSNLHAAYNTQILVSNGLIASFIVTQSRSDTKDFIKAVNKYYEMYNTYPKIICADAGYGSKENYDYMDKHEIESYVKHRTWEGNVSGRNPVCYELYKNNTIRCLNGNIGVKVNEDPSKQSTSLYIINGCNSCDFKYYCKKALSENNKLKDYRIFQINEKLQFQIQSTQNRLLSPKGIELRVNRSSQVEGVFGIMKQDLKYTRFKRVSIEKVSTEFMLVCLGYNIRKLFSYFEGKSKFKYWIAPSDLEAEKIKKPSAKRLTNKTLKQKRKSLNTIAKDTYKRK